MTLKTTLIDATELAALSPENVLIVDCRFELDDPSKGERDYGEGHIAGAVYASLNRDLSDLSREAEGLGRHPLPLESAFNMLLSRWGWHRDMQVVSYDSAGGALAAARLWWLLRLAGVRAAAVLDGGYAAWLSAGLPVATGESPERQPSTVSLHYDPSQVLVDHAAVRDGAAGQVLDARGVQRYSGEVEPRDPVGGHIPGALNRPFAENLDSDGHFKSPTLLREEFAAVLGNTSPDHVVHMCGSGVTACHNILAMEHAGLHGSRLYAPSWSGWVSDLARPVAKG